MIYYPELKLEQVQQSEEDLEDWYSVMLYRLICVCKNASSKYTRSKVRKALPKDFAYVIEELLNGRPDVSDQEAYYNEIIHSVIRTGRAPEPVSYTHLDVYKRQDLRYGDPDQWRLSEGTCRIPGWTSLCQPEP